MKANLPLRNNQNLNSVSGKNEGLASIDSLPLKKSCTVSEQEGKSSEIQENCFCRTHPDLKGHYFLAEQPWIRLCKQCALNKALCGHQIQKQYSQHQFQKKITLTNVIQQIQSTLKSSETQGKYLVHLAENIDKNYLQHVSSHLKFIDELLKDLNKLRDSIYSLYEINVSKKVSELYERQSHLSVCSANLTNHLQNIQNYYSDLISDEINDNQQFTRHIEIVKREIDRARKGLYMDYEKKQLQKIAYNLPDLFIPKLIQIKNKKHLFQQIQIPIKQQLVQQKMINEPVPIQTRKDNNINNNDLVQRQSFPVKMDETRFYSGRQRSKKNNSTHDENQTTRRQANLSLRSSAKKQSICSITKVNTSCKKQTGLKQSNSSLFNTLGCGGQTYFH